MKKHYIKKLFATVAVLLCSITSNAYDFEVDGIYYNIISATDLTVEVTKGKYTGKVIIPSNVVYKSKVLTVTSIGPSAFSSCDGLTSVVIGNSVTSIGDYAFNNCSSLESVTIGNSVTSIGNRAFNLCTSLKDLRIEDGKGTLSLGYNYENNSGDGEGLFYDCPLETLYLGRNLSYNTYNTIYSYGYSPFYKKTTLTSVTIGSSVTRIEDYAFRGCTGLTSIIIPNSVKSIGKYAFTGCDGLKSVTIGDGVTSIGVYAFTNCSSLESVTIGNSVTSIGDYAFSSCDGLTSIEIPNSVTSIGKYAFYACDGLTSIEIPNSVTSIGELAFRDCSSLTNVTIGNSVTSIENYAFYGCSSLTNVTIGNSVTTIERYVFEGCDSLASIRLLGETPPTVGSNNFTNKQYMNMIVYVPKGTLATYQATGTWKNFWDIREEGTTETPDEEVKKCATPVITYNNSGLDITTKTDGAEIHTKITCNDVGSYNDGRIDLSATYNITTYATKEGYLNSETATATLCWIAASGDSEDNSIIKVEAMPVLITCNNGTINICGGKEGAEVVVYTTSGVAVGNATITNGNATISTGLAKGEIAVISIAGKGIKVVMQ